MVRLKGFKKLVSVEKALEIFLGQLTPKRLGNEQILLKNALGRVTADDVISEMDLPPYNRSTMDGYAVKGADTFGTSPFKPKTLKLTNLNVVSSHEAKPIWTGNRLPKGADAVVMLEQTRRITGEIEVWEPVAPGANVSKQGEDIKRGETAIKDGVCLRPHHLGLVAAIGKTSLSVVKQPEVTIISTGSELINGNNKLGEGKVVEVNSIILSGMCREIGAVPKYQGVAVDTLEEISSKLKIGIKCADVVITTGGTSVGARDYVIQSLNLGGPAKLVLHGIAMRPGMPTAISIIDSKPVLSLSGNPVAAIFGFEVFARPIILSMAGNENMSRPTLKARLAKRVVGALGKKVFLRVNVLEKGGEYLAEPIGVKGSGNLSTMTRAKGYVIIPESREGLESGEWVTVHLFDNYWR